MRTIAIARQPIYDRRLNRVGYELFYRAGGEATPAGIDLRDASTHVIVNTFIDIGIDNLVGSALAFINVPATLLQDVDLQPLFPQQTVFELPSDVEPDAALVAALKCLKAQGFGIALDNFVYRDALRPLLELADYVKLDVLALTGQALDAQWKAVRGYGVKTVAQRVETVATFSEALVRGFDYFQGYFFYRPQTLSDRTTSANHAVVLRLLQKLADPRLNLNELEATLAADVAMSYKLLRYANSAAFGRRREIESLRDAIMLVGLDTVRGWAALILLDSVASGKPEELIRTAMVRAAMCERLAAAFHPQLRSQAFIVGLFSLLDAIMDMPMERLLDDLALSAPVKFALLGFEGELGELLRAVLLYEQANWSELEAHFPDVPALAAIYEDAVKWADNNVNSLFDRSSS